jgi:hypothetical protein
MDDERGARRHRGCQVAGQTDLLNLFICEDAHDHHVGAVADRGQFGDVLRAEFAYGTALLIGSAERADVVAGLDETGHHGCTHASRSDEPDARHAGLFFA